MKQEKIWWYARANERFGPVSVVELKSMANDGRLIATDLIWKKGLERWVLASSAKGLIPPKLEMPNCQEPPPLPMGNQENTCTMAVTALASKDQEEAAPPSVAEVMSIASVRNKSIVEAENDTNKSNEISGLESYLYILKISFWGQFVAYAIFMMGLLGVLVFRESEGGNGGSGLLMMFSGISILILVLTFYISVGVIAKRCGFNWIIWVFAPMIIGPFGFIVVYFMLTVAVRNLKTIRQFTN